MVVMPCSDAHGVCLGHPQVWSPPPGFDVHGRHHRLRPGGVLLLPPECRAYFFRRPARGGPKDYPEFEAAVVADAMFGPRLQQLGY